MGRKNREPVPEEDQAQVNEDSATATTKPSDEQIQAALAILGAAGMRVGGPTGPRKGARDLVDGILVDVYGQPKDGKNLTELLEVVKGLGDEDLVTMGLVEPLRKVARRIAYRAKKAFLAVEAGNTGRIIPEPGEEAEEEEEVPAEEEEQ